MADARKASFSENEAKWVLQGVHLDDPLTPRQLSDAASESEHRFEEELFPGAIPKYIHSSSFASSLSDLDLSSTTSAQQVYKKCTLTTHSTKEVPIKTKDLNQKAISIFEQSKSHATTSQSSAKFKNGNSRVMSPKDCDKSSSKMCQSDVTNQQAKTSQKTPEPVQSSASNPVSPVEKKEVKKSLFSFYLGETSNNSSCGKVSTISKTSDPVTVDKTELRRLSSAQEKYSGKGRFKKILHPLRRSKSTGNTKDVPAHALFLRHHTDMEAERRKSQEKEKKSAGRSSTEPVSSNESSDDDSSSDKKHKDTKETKKKKSLAKDVKEKFSFLRRRHTDTSLHGKMGGEKPGSSKSSSDAARSWTKSFDTLLMDKHGLELFREFLRTEFSEENIEFWIACEEYKNSKSSKNLGPCAQKIYTDFVAVQAPHEINLDSKTREATLDSLDHPNRHTFEAAQKRIQALMEKDSYPRFLRSDVYLDLISHKS